MNLSIIIPAIAGREENLRALMGRLLLSHGRFPNNVEIIILDGSTDQEYLCVYDDHHDKISMKYISMSIGRYINPAYIRNVMLRVCEGKVISMLDIDHWVSENIICGMLSPFIEDSYENEIINRGYVVGTDKSKMGGRSVNQDIMDSKDRDIMDVYKQFKIPHGINDTLWIWSMLRETVLSMSGYDEVFCCNFHYGQEDSNFRQRLLAKMGGYYDGQNRKFCAIHLDHPAYREGSDDVLDYYRENDFPCSPDNIVRNIDWDWGKMISDSFSIIDGQKRGCQEHEEWVRGHIPDVPSYSDTWGDIENFVESIGVYAKARTCLIIKK